MNPFTRVLNTCTLDVTPEILSKSRLTSRGGFADFFLVKRQYLLISRMGRIDRLVGTA